MDGSQSLKLAGVCFILALRFFGASEIAPLHGQFAVSPVVPWVLNGFSAFAGFGALCYVVYGIALGTNETPGGECP
jgi:hypothetical protein